MNHVDIDDLAAAVMEGLEEYVELAEDAMKDAVTQTAKAVRKELVTTSPDGKTGRYRKGWRASVVEDKAHMRHMTVHNRKYQIVHLLEKGHNIVFYEKGHVKRNGGRVAARPHVAPAEEHGAEMLETLITEALGG